MTTEEIVVINSGFAKPNNSWLGRWYVIKTFDKLDECDIDEIRQILQEDEISGDP